MNKLLVAAICALVLGLCGCASGSTGSGSASSAGSPSAASPSTPSASTASPSASAPSGSSQEAVDIVEDTTDQLYYDEAYGQELLAFQFGNEVFTLDYFYPLEVWGDSFQDGGFYKVVADVTYLNGGVAGYVDYPEIHDVHSVEAVSPFDLGLASVQDNPHGLSLIGDYADGDILLNISSRHGVWKDGAWAYRYDREKKLDDGTAVLVRDGVALEDVQAGRDAGVLSCADYFVLPNAG